MTERRPSPENAAGPSWQGLSPEAQAALIRRAAVPSAATQLLASDGGSSENKDDQALEWAMTELESFGKRKGALERWKKYEDLLGVERPTSIDDLLEEGGAEFEEKISRLFRAKQALTASGETTPSGENIGDTMQLVLIPWKAYAEILKESQAKSNGRILERWMSNLIRCRKDLKNVFQFENAGGTSQSRNVQDIFTNDYEMYRAPGDPSRLQSLTGYLKDRISEDGEWGVMLMQRADSGGYLSQVRTCADEYTESGTENFQIAGYDVDAMGFFEWTSLTLQTKNNGFGDEAGFYFLLGNRLRSLRWPGAPEVPTVCWDTYAGFSTTNADYQEGLGEPEGTILAVS